MRVRSRNVAFPTQCEMNVLVLLRSASVTCTPTFLMDAENT